MDCVDSTTPLIDFSATSILSPWLEGEYRWRIVTMSTVYTAGNVNSIHIPTQPPSLPAAPSLSADQTYEVSLAASVQYASLLSTKTLLQTKGEPVSGAYSLIAVQVMPVISADLNDDAVINCDAGIRDASLTARGQSSACECAKQDATAATAVFIIEIRESCGCSVFKIGVKSWTTVPGLDPTCARTA
mmetsp:Transcript_57442/g.163693  ORF Transcript_57442/g.163693 Transcript_57442/m.163693 type:complete len:188 (+) Transcript_57442:958-1521(+)